MSDSFKKASRIDWCPAEGRTVTNDDIRTGALQRIADATELMAKRHAELMAERDRYKGWYDGERARRQQLERQVAAYKGQITRLKKRPASPPSGSAA